MGVYNWTPEEIGVFCMVSQMMKFDPAVRKEYGSPETDFEIMRALWERKFPELQESIRKYKDSLRAQKS